MKIAITVLTWNFIHHTKICIESLVIEAKKLEELGHDVFIMVCDNGSTDGTQEFIKSNDYPIKLIELNENTGQSYPKKIMIDYIVACGCDYFYLFDNDVQAIPNSLPVMLDYIDKNDNVGCFGHRIEYYSKDLNDDVICKKMPIVDDLEIELNIKSGLGGNRAWTHYGIYRVKMFREGVFHDVPYIGPGYGFCDDDLGTQILYAGYDVACFKNVYCFHDLNSSVPVLEKLNELNFNRREQWFKNKWKEKLRLDEK